MKTLTDIRFGAFLLLIVSIYSPLAHGQDSLGKIPSPPYVNPLTGDFTMVKKFVYKMKTHESASDPNLTAEQKAVQKILASYKDVKELDVIQIGSVRRDTETFTDGTGRELWRSGQWQFTPNPIHPELYVVSAMRGGLSPLIPMDFMELQWLNGGAFKGEQNFQGVKCFVFKSGNEMALIDESTSWPIYFESNVMQVSYTYGTPPVLDLKLPPNLVKRLDDMKKSWGSQ